MSRKRFTTEQIIHKLRHPEAFAALSGFSWIQPCR